MYKYAVKAVCSLQDSALANKSIADIQSQNLCPAVTMDNYFQTASTRRLGQTQIAQFQSGNQYGASWIWGSKCTADNVCSDSNTPKNNALVEMSRSYHQGNDAFGNYYNWFAATAEAGTYSMTSGNATDSVCPKGWKLPIEGGSAIAKSWGGLLTGSYGISDNAVSSAEMRKSNLSFAFSGFYAYDTGNYTHNAHGLYWTATAHYGVTLLQIAGVISCISVT